MDNTMTPQHGRDLTVGSIPRQLVAFALPMLAGVMLFMAYSFVNAIWVGQYLGKAALAAVTVSLPIFLLIVSLGNGLTVAANILVAQHMGARRYDAIPRVVNTSVILIGGVGIALFVLGEIGTEPILRLLQTPDAVMHAATGYMRVFLLAQPFIFGMFLIRSLLQGIGDSTPPLYVQVASVGFNVILDPVLMFGWLGAPRLGLQGAAWASVIAEVTALLVMLAYLHRQRNPVSPDWKRLRVHLPTIWTLIRIGIPASVQQALVSIATLCVVGLVNGFGETAIAAFGAATRLEQLILVPAMVFGLAISTLAGQNIGANKPQRVREILLWGSLLSGVITALVSLVTLTVPKELLRIFIHDAAVIHLGVIYLRIVTPFYLCFAVMSVYNGIINGAGDTLATTLISVGSQLVLRVPLAMALIHILHNITGIWIAIAFSFIVSMLASIAYYGSCRWKHPNLPSSPPVETQVSGIVSQTDHPSHT
ncbi:MAG TPA: MATE family efflux transporter [Armatimonadota bacterium]|jgi:putative MATE family efflux protein